MTKLRSCFRGNFLIMFLAVCCVFLEVPWVSSRNKYWLLGKKCAVNMRWPAAAAELQSDLAYFPWVCNHALQELFSFFGKNTVPTCCSSPAGLLSLLAIAWVYNFLADTRVVLSERPAGLQALTESCQLQQWHRRISSILIFSPSFITLYFSGTSPSIECSHLGKVVPWCAQTHPDPAAGLWWCQFIWGLSWCFQELSPVFSWWKSSYDSIANNVDFGDVNESSSYSRRPCSRLRCHGLAKPLLQMIDTNFLTAVCVTARCQRGVLWGRERCGRCQLKIWISQALNASDSEKGLCCEQHL